jgi:hypothetical protein
MIREKYGEGELMLIKNYKIGAGKGIKYCSLEEAKGLEISDLNLEDVYKELAPFIKDYEKEKPIKIKKEKKEDFIILGRQMGKSYQVFNNVKQRSLF